MDIKEEDILGGDVGRHWYYRAKGAALQQMLDGVPCRTVIDVGAGSGFFSRLLLAAGQSNAATCIDPGYAAETDGDVNGRLISFRREASSRCASLVLMMDVLEHVDDDRGLMRGYLGSLEPGGHVLITVPAFNWLWSGHDEFLEHRRRYTAAGLERVVRDAGLEVVATRYFFAMLLPLVVPLRLWDKLMVRAGQRQPQSSLRRYPDWVNNLLAGALGIERRLFFPVNRFGGLSLFCLARRTS